MFTIDRVDFEPADLAWFCAGSADAAERLR